MRRLNVLAAVVMAIAAWSTFTTADAGDLGELSGGSITGPMISASYIAALLFVISALLQFRHHGLATWFSIAGAALALPWASWLLLPGMWCGVSNCSLSYPVVAQNWKAVLIVVLPMVALALRRKA